MSDHNDVQSDYGSDLSPDEETLVNGFISEFDDNIKAGSELAATTFDDHENPRGFRLPRHTERENPTSPSLQSALQFNGDSDYFEHLQGNHPRRIFDDSNHLIDSEAYSQKR